MKDEIIQRIMIIRRGGIPVGYMKTKLGIRPKDWTRYKIKEILNRKAIPVTVELEQRYREIGIRSHGKGIFYKEEITGSKLGNKSVFWVQPNCFIVNIVFAWELAVSKTTEKEIGYIASHRFPMYEPFDGKLDLGFITYFFKSQQGENILNLASPGGAGRNKTLGQKEFLESEVVIPKDIKEQQKIAQILSTCDKVIELKEKLIELKKKQKKGLMQGLLTGKVKVPGFKEEWKEFLLRNIGSTYSGITGKSKEDFGRGKPFIPYKNVFDNSKVDIERLEYVEITDTETQNKVKFGDILFTTSSENPEEVGMNSVLLDDVEDELYLNSFCFGYRLNDFKTLIPEFAQYLFRGNVFRANLLRLAQGSTRFNLSKNEVLKMWMKLPSINEQKKIASILMVIDKEIKLLEQKLEAYKEQKKGLMQVLLTGKVRVKF